MWKSMKLKKIHIISCCYKLRLFHDLFCLIRVQFFRDGFNSFSWRYFTILKWWVMETLSTNGFIRLRSSNKFDFLWFNCSLSESSWLCTVNTNSSQFVNFLSQRNKVNDVSKRFSLECAVQSCDNDNNSSICKFFCDFDNIFKELSFIDTNYIVFLGLFKNVFKFWGFQGFVCNSWLMINFTYRELP